MLYIRERAEVGLKYMDAIIQLLPLRLRIFRLKIQISLVKSKNGTPCQTTGVPFLVACYLRLSAFQGLLLIVENGMCLKIYVLWLKAALFGEAKVGEILVPFLHPLVSSLSSAKTMDIRDCKKFDTARSSATVIYSKILHNNI